MAILIPLNIDRKTGQISLVEKERNAIDNFLKLLLSTPQHNCVCNPEFGFVFTNFRFEIFNEKDGVMNYESTSNEFDENKELYNRKITGTSKNINTFAKELQTTVEKYEKRLSNITTSMSYAREKRLITITVNGVIKSSGENYTYNSTIKVWS